MPSASAHFACCSSYGSTVLLLLLVSTHTPVAANRILGALPPSTGCCIPCGLPRLQSVRVLLVSGAVDCVWQTHHYQTLCRRYSRSSCKDSIAYVMPGTVRLVGLLRCNKHWHRLCRCTVAVSSLTSRGILYCDVERPSIQRKPVCDRHLLRQHRRSAKVHG